MGWTQESLEEQFTDVIENSNRYQDYKVVKIHKLNSLKQQVNDSISALRNTIDTQQSNINSLETSIDSLQQKVRTTEEALAVSKKKVDGIYLFGILLSKSTYNAILWTIIALALLLTLYFFSRQRNGIRASKEAREKLSETEAEFEGHRQRSLEREQQLRRKLQDEINKQKKA